MTVINERIPFCLPDITEREIAEVVDTLRSGWLTTGPKTKRFEQEFAEYAGAPHAVALNSCTAALHLALSALGVDEGDEVITTPYTFVSSAETIVYHRARPVFVDVDPRTLCLDPAGLEAAITPRTRAVVPVDIAGHPAALDEILEIAHARGLKVVEDAAHATESWQAGRKVGAIADATCFSFYATKNLATGEGGMLTTADGELAAKARILGLHGMSKDAWKRYDKGGSWFYEIVETGFKYNLTDLASALGLVQLARIEEMRAKRLALKERLFEILSQAPDLFELPETGEAAGHVHAWHLFMLRLRLDALRIDRARFIEELGERGIQASVHFIPVHLHPWYRRSYGYRGGEFPVAEAEYAREISLPFFSALSLEQATRVGEACLEIGRAQAR
jgi:dTDP-4-amino-4,6-dideoxygalactose transaminase